MFSILDAENISHDKNELHPFAFEAPPPKYSAEYILKLLLDPNIDQSRVCRVWPVSGVISNATFVVDITSLKHPDDVRKDFFGKWIHSGSHPFTFKATIEKDGDVYVENVPLVHREMSSTCVDSIAIIHPILISGGCLLLSLVCLYVYTCVYISGPACMASKIYSTLDSITVCLQSPSNYRQII